MVTSMTRQARWSRGFARQSRYCRKNIIRAFSRIKDRQDKA
jgi:hypothetical protein